MPVNDRLKPLQSFLRQTDEMSVAFGERPTSEITHCVCYYVGDQISRKRYEEDERQTEIAERCRHPRCGIHQRTLKESGEKK